MGIEIDYYQFLGLPSGKEGSKLTLAQITKAYKKKALEFHPDKRPNDPNAQSNFQKLKLCYDILKDESSRKAFDDTLARVKRKLPCSGESQSDRKRRKADLEEREKVRVTDDKNIREERIAKELKKDIEKLCSMHSKNVGVGRLGKSAPTRNPSSIPADFEVHVACRPNEEAILEKMRKAAEKQNPKSSKE